VSESSNATRERTVRAAVKSPDSDLTFDTSPADHDRIREIFGNKQATHSRPHNREQTTFSRSALAGRGPSENVVCSFCPSLLSVFRPGRR